MTSPFVWIVATLAAVLLLLPAIGGCPSDSSVTDNDRQRCCKCLGENECLDEGDNINTCREDLTEEGVTDFDPDCQTTNCGRECDFLYWN